MIVAGFALLAIGAADLVRQFAPRRWIGYLTVAIILLLLGSVSDALLPMIAALAVGAVWVWCMPSERRAPLGFWPAVLLGILVIGAVVWLGPRRETGLIGEIWELRSPFGEIPFDLAILALGAGVFLLESANLVVRAALDGEHTWRPIDIARPAAPAESDPVVTASSAPGDGVPPRDGGVADPEADPLALAGTAAPVDPRSGFKGGRLIGPLERILVLILTLAAAYPILAAMLAAKGIVRFPEISRDGETGARAEYFLVGSLVSWVIALGGAFLVWWAAHS
ncbi:hypothetical protein [Microbacterium sp. 1.5R]|uniref:hypothetical protein n=1 Tax=Microbacterium sp. 1.5R TaxID=1916917 RepID=UPI0011A06D03|nr:hypothetical protein [Microbacterium sp. 1.5R]